jgi:uncharacterized membrane protein YfcA
MKSFIAVFVIASLSGLGVGSGGILVIYLTLIEGMPQLAAQGANLIFFILASLASLLFNLPKRRIPYGAVAIMATLGIAGSLGGTYLASVIPAAVLRKIFGAMLVGSGILALKKG